MSEKGSVTKAGGSGLLTAGIVIAVVIAAGTYMNMRSTPPLSEEDLAAVVPADTDGAAPAAVAPQATDGESVEAAPETTQEVSVAETPAAVEAVEEPEAPGGDETVAGVAEDTDVPADDTTAESAAPSIDEVRVEADGVAVIAGRAAPGSDVEVVVDGNVVATTRADSAGSFAALGTVDATDGPQVLSLRATEDNESVVSRNEVIIAPVSPVNLNAASSAETESAAAPVETAQNTAVDESSAGSVVAEDPVATPSEVAENVLEAITDVEPETSAESTDVVSETHVSEDSAPQIAVLQSNEQGVSLMQTAPAPPNRVVLDTIGYSDSGVVQLAGRASEEASEVRIYLNNRAVANFQLDTAGSWRGDVLDIDAGVYTLRVDALTSSGTVASRIETPFKREEPEALARASQGQEGPVKAITVQTGDTLWAIARERYGEGVLYVRVFDANRSDIRDPDLIYPGQIFDLPDD